MISKSHLRRHIKDDCVLRLLLFVISTQIKEWEKLLRVIFFNKGNTSPNEDARDYQGDKSIHSSCSSAVVLLLKNVNIIHVITQRPSGTVCFECPLLLNILKYSIILFSDYS